MIFKLSKAIYFIACLFLFFVSAFSLYSYGFAGDFVWAELLVLASSFLGLCSFFIPSNLSRLGLILSSFLLGLLAAYTALQAIRSNGDGVGGSGEIYNASAFEIFAPIFIFLLCVSVLSCSFFEKGLKLD